jgi:hypothetical protein
MPAAAQAAAGTTLAIDKLGTGITYTVLSQVVSITGVGGGETGEAETTHLSSTVKTTRPTLKDPSDVEFELNFDPNDVDHQYVQGLQLTSEIASWRVAFPQITTPRQGTFDAWVKSVEGVNADGVEEILKATVTLRVTSDTTWANIT